LGYDNKYNEVLFTIEGSVYGQLSYKSAITGGYDYKIDLLTGLDIFRHNEDLINIGINDTIENNYYDDKVYEKSSTLARLEYPNSFSFSSDQSLTVGSSYNLYLKDTLCFNESFDVFQSFYSLYPTYYINHELALFSNFEDLSIQSFICKHNANSKGLFYTNNELDSSLTLLINQDYMYTKVFDNILFLTTCRSITGVEQFETTFDKVRFYNEYQNTDWVDLTYKTNYEKRERHFAMAIPRNIVDKNVTQNLSIFDSDNLDETNKFKERIRDKSLFIDCRYTNDNNEDFSISYIITKYRISYR
jgi:hypothetical protein